MYADHSPIPQLKMGRVIVIQKSDKPYGPDFAELLIDMAFENDAVTGGGDNITFWIVYDDEPRRVWDFTERALRSSFRTKTPTTA